MNFSKQKQLVKKFYADLDASSEQDLPAILEQYCGADYFWRGFHPFNELQGAEQVATTFWQPLRTALTSAWSWATSSASRRTFSLAATACCSASSCEGT